jgi:hypothetical protein
MSHTPGPWSVHLGIIRCPLGLAVADVETNPKHQHSAAREANAVLIAAAPDLLFALENLLAVKYGEGGTVFDSDEIARAAIAKAKGG